MMLFRCLLAICLLLAATGAIQARESEQIQRVQLLLRNGNPDQAIATAETLLSQKNTQAFERKALLELLVQAELIRAKAKHYSEVGLASHAIDSLLKEFPDHPRTEELRWKQAWIWWKHGETEKAANHIRQLLASSRKPEIQRQSWMLLARMHIEQRHWAKARRDLLQYGLLAEENTQAQWLGLVWTAIIDMHEGRDLEALDILGQAHQRWPEMIEKEPVLFSALIQLMDRHDQHQSLARLTATFIERYFDTPEAPAIRLIQADLAAATPSGHDEAEKKYAILADEFAETTVGRLAFLRHMMLKLNHVRDPAKLASAIASIQRVADHNQLSPVEDEALLDLGILWTRLLGEKPLPVDQVKDPALDFFARSTTAKAPDISQKARGLGADWLKRQLNERLDAQQWMAAISMWRRYPQLRPKMEEQQDLYLQIAHAMRMMLLFEQAESMLETLYQKNRQSLRGQRVMLELANLWLERGDNDGLAKIMRWLNEHPYTLFRPEMVLIAARMQLQQGQSDAANQTLASVSPTDLAIEARATYWETQAKIHEALHRWHLAAKAWQQYGNSKFADRNRGLLRQANAWFHSKAFAAAEKTYLQLPDEMHDAAWEYRVAQCALLGGKPREAQERLEKLAANPDAGVYATLARAALKEAAVKQLVSARP